MTACFVLHGPIRHGEQRLAFMDQTEVNLAAIQVDAADLYPHAGTYGVTDARALATQLLAGFVKTEILTAQLSDMHQALHIHGVQRDKNAEARGCCDHTAKLFAQMLAHVLAL